MHFITPFEPRVSQYLVPSSVSKIDFYGQMAIDLPPGSLMETPRKVYIIELLDDPGHTRLVSFTEPRCVKGNWSDTIDDRLYDHLKDEGEWEGWVRRAAREVPPGIEIERTHIRSMMADRLEARWWEVTL